VAKECFEVRAKMHHLSGAMNFNLELFGDELAIRNEYKENKGLDAIQFYLMSKYGWLPSVVKSMSMEDLRFALSEEMSGWTIPVDARNMYPVEGVDWAK
jgi:hypothetical protein